MMYSCLPSLDLTYAMYIRSFFQDFDGPQLLDFHVSFPNQPTFMYKMNLGEETMMAPMGLFYPEIFGITRKGTIFTQQRNQGDPEDIHDEIFLLQTQTQQQQVGIGRNL